MSKSVIKKIVMPVIAAVIVLCMLVVFAVIGALAVSNISVVAKGDKISDSFEGEKYDCILVLGAGLRADGTPSDMLADRLTVAIDLYNQGVSNKILLSGDRSDERNYDEVTAMETFCISHGVNRNDILKDEKGYSTYESVDNIDKIGDFKRIVIVTQKYHLYRAIYIADEMGYEAVGADAAIREYSGQTWRDVREIAARLKDFLMVNISNIRL